MKPTILTFLKAINFFPRYAPTVGNWARKALGISGRGKTLTFNEKDKEAIRTGIDKMAAELKEMV